MNIDKSLLRNVEKIIVASELIECFLKWSTDIMDMTTRSLIDNLIIRLLPNAFMFFLNKMMGQSFVTKRIN